eukprot:CAMPEP_0202687458 /NCGR_PEP_ID=MMETSP1385-20130828/3139_1 /ASSEMBLY_ACC=CAM_ASM_000861 /TAXON_ID=933848 /ORGANISM="Elphidium margaritaceum" /LENGTH=220 /DNA_ID=CAMNT_0049342255 /DNA_START=22 /DNA_END=680 /DNA_ORIENTATION=+
METLSPKGSMWSGNHRELLVTGFIKTSATRMQIPTAIKCLIFKYYPKFENIQFLRHSEYYAATEWNEGHILRSSDRTSTLYSSRLFASNVGFNRDLHCWKIRYTGAGSGLSTFGCIGVVSQVSYVAPKRKSKSEINSSSMGNAYYFDQHHEAIFGYCDGEKIDEITQERHAQLEEVKKTWHHNDEVAVLLDCCQWTLSFYVNEKHFVGTIRIQPHLTYYP